MKLSWPVAPEWMQLSRGQHLYSPALLEADTRGCSICNSPPNNSLPYSGSSSSRSKRGRHQSPDKRVVRLPLRGQKSSVEYWQVFFSDEFDAAPIGIPEFAHNNRIEES
jgi:hypothetical protein